MFQIIEKVGQILNRLNADVTKVEFEIEEKGTMVVLWKNDLHCAFIIPSDEENIEQEFISPALHALAQG